MKIVEVPINEIKPYDNNPRVNDTTAEKLAVIIQEYGFINPVILDKNNVIVAGHTRYKAALLNGLKTLPSVYINDELTDEQINAFRLADNKVAEKAAWDYAKLQEELKKLVNINLDEFGLTIDTDTLDDIKFDPPEETEKAPKTTVCPYCGKVTRI